VVSPNGLLVQPLAILRGDRRVGTGGWIVAIRSSIEATEGHDGSVPSRSSFIHSKTAACLTSIDRPTRPSGGWAHFEKLVFKTLERVRDLDGIDSVDRLSERLILQIASRVVAECGRNRAIEMLEAVAAGTIEIGPFWNSTA